MDEEVAESSEKIRKRIEKARQAQVKRFKNSKTMTNSEMTITQIKKICQLDQTSEKLLKDALEKFILSARAYHRILKVSRTIADLAESDKINVEHVAESIQYRTKMDENLF